jgi:SAM-dependent methyltransferase
MGISTKRNYLSQVLALAHRRGGWRRLLRNLYCDLRYGGRALGGIIYSQETEKGYFDVQNTDYAILDLLFRQVRLTSDDIFVDIGCGKGRVFNYLLHRGFPGQMIGFEVNAAVAEFTRKRLSRYPKVRIVEADICKVKEIPGTVYYLFNPFAAPILQKFIAALETAWDQRPSVPQRPLVIYYNCVYLSEFERTGKWRIIERLSPQESLAGSGSAILAYIGNNTT